MIELELPWPPTVNTYYSVVNNRKILSKKGRSYKADALKMASETYRGTSRKIDGHCQVEILAYVPDLRKRDLDNILKPILDCLVDGRYIEDDSLIQRLQIERKEKTKNGLIIVYVKEWEDGK